MLRSTVVINLLLMRGAMLYPSGAPQDACLDMTPRHSGSTSQPISTSPYSILVSSNEYARGVPLIVTINGTQPLKGFLIRAGSTLEPIGRFENSLPTSKDVCVSPDGTSAALTHTNSSDKAELSLRWTAPTSLRGPVMFYATIVKDYSTYWVKIPSSVIADGGRSSDMSTLPAPTTADGVNLEKISKDGCGITKSCISWPENCVGTDCTYIVTWFIEPPTATAQLAVRFNMQAKVSNAFGYVSLGFAKGLGMNGISIVNCIDGGDQVRITQTYAVTTDQPPLIPGSGNVVNVTAMSDGDNIRCAFTWINDLSAREPNADKLLDLTGQHYVVMARGSAAGSIYIGKHIDTPPRLGEKIVVASSIYKDYTLTLQTSSSVWLLKIHGALMTIAWVFCCTTTVVLARFYKKHWLSTKLCGEKMWFALHRGFALACTGLTIVAFILAFVAVGGWSSAKGLPWDSHAYLGVAVTALAIVNPIMGLFRCNPGTARRRVFNVAHWLVGNAALVLAGAALLVGLQMSTAVSPKWLLYVGAAYVAWFGAAYCGLLLEEKLRASCVGNEEAADIDHTLAMESLKATSENAAASAAASSSCSQETLRTVFFVVHLLVAGAVAVSVLVTILAHRDE